MTATPSTARIIALPTATAQPVVQPPRRGRYPKKVLCFYRERERRQDAVRAARELADEIAHWESQARLCARNAQYNRERLAEHNERRAQ